MSSGSESDEDYVPEEPEKLSEEESANEETEKQYETEMAHKVKRRKAMDELTGKKKAKTKNGVKELASIDNAEKPVEETNNSEEDKQREEDLWAKFLEGTDTKPKKTLTNDTCIKNDEVKQTNNKDDVKKTTEPLAATSLIDKNINQKSKETKIFEFAGEKIVVEDNVIKEKLKVDTPVTENKKEATSSKRAPGSSGLSNILGQIGKKGKLSTLEKSKLDWTTYKKQEGIEEEIQSHNKGKQGYLDRRDFLERADLRQYEIERDLRLTRRSNR